MTGDKNLFKEVTKINGGNVKFSDDSKGKTVATGTVPFNNNCNITKVYLVDRLNYNLLSISQLCDFGYEVNFKKTCFDIEDESGNPNDGIKTRRSLKKKSNITLISQIEPKKVDEALKDSSWVQAMHEKLDQFDKNQVWTLVPKPANVAIIVTKWLFRNKLNEEDKVVRNKARLVAQGYSQQEGIDYDETFAPIARLESIRIVLAHASFKGFKQFQMNVKSALLNEFIDDEVYVKQSPGFENSQFSYHVFKLTKALYGLKQAPRAWYERLSSFLINHGFKRKKQGSVALSTTEAEYIAIGQCCAQLLWMSHQLSDYDLSFKLVQIFCDNSSDICLSKNLMHHSRKNHIDIKHYFIRDHVLKGDIKISFLSTNDQLADIFTKHIVEDRFQN
ncbi:uncharacterized protein [Nicotiana tomentosiformis]|uniref:uncharacterized protein n=1 Tax=Nicotiana tomentosiformis TaxID=4098 RepID=UPI00388CC978